MGLVLPPQKVEEEVRQVVCEAVPEAGSPGGDGAERDVVAVPLAVVAPYRHDAVGQDEVKYQGNYGRHYEGLWLVGRMRFLVSNRLEMDFLSRARSNSELVPTMMVEGRGTNL